MKKLVLFLIALISTISLTSFADNTQKQIKTSIIPLAVGNIWHLVDTNGERHYAEIQEKITHDGDVWYKYRELSDDDIFYVNNSAEGQIEIDIDNNERTLVLPYPVEEETLYSQFGVPSRVIPNVEVTVKAGTFNTYQYDFSLDTPDNPITLWIAPGIGPVKNLYEGEVYELVEYSLK